MNASHNGSPITENVDLVDFALDHVSPEKMRELAYRQLKKQMCDVMNRPTPLNGERHAAKVLHAAKRHMATEKSIEFATAIFEASGLDTRDTKLTNGPTMLTLACLLNMPSMNSRKRSKDEDRYA